MRPIEALDPVRASHLAELAVASSKLGLELDKLSEGVPKLSTETLGSLTEYYRKNPPTATSTARPVTYEELAPVEEGIVVPPADEISGLTNAQWKLIITTAVSVYQSGQDITEEAICRRNKRVDTKLVGPLLRHSKFRAALEQRGVTPNWSGLSERQMLLLSSITDFSDKRSLSTKLKAARVPNWEFKVWQANPTFRKEYRRASEELFEEAQASVNVSLTQNAVNGDLASQKYFNEVSGRFNPATQSTQDVRAVLQAVVEVLTSTITDPDLLREISGKLSTVMVAQGVGR